MKFHIKDHQQLYEQPVLSEVKIQVGQKVKAFTRQHGAHVFALHGTLCFEDIGLAKSSRIGEDVWLIALRAGQTKAHYCDDELTICNTDNYVPTKLRDDLKAKQKYMEKYKHTAWNGRTKGFSKKMKDWGWHLIETDIDTLSNSDLKKWTLKIQCISAFPLTISAKDE